MGLNLRTGAWRTIVVVFFLPGVLSGKFTVQLETELRNGLQTFYSTHVRPSMKTSIQLGINLMSIKYLDIKNEVFSISGSWTMRWADRRLKWSDNSSIKIPILQIYPDIIWTPALIVANSVKDLSAINDNTIPMRVRADGLVTWNPPCILMTSCEVDVTNFPFDSQTCSVNVTSFGYTVDELNIIVGQEVNTKYFQPHGEWTLTKVWSKRTQYREDRYTYSRVAFYFRLERRAMYYGLNMLLPVVVNSLLIPLVFLLPHDAGEKIGYCLTVLLAYVVLLTIVANGLPTTAKTTSLLGVYIAVVLLMSALSVALSILSLHLYHRSNSVRIPRWQRKLARLARIITFQGQCRDGRRVEDVSRQAAQSPSDQTHNTAVQFFSPASAPTLADPRGQLSAGGETKGKPASPAPFSRQRDVLSPSEVNTDVSSGIVKDDGEGEDECIDGEEAMTWSSVAKIYDGFWLRCYFLIIFCSGAIFVLFVMKNRF